MSFSYHEHFQKALNEFAKIFSKNPYSSLYESDAQVLLATILAQEFDGFQHLFKVDGEEPMNIGKVHTEYPNELRLDVVILSPTSVNDRTPYEQDIAYGIELKLIPYGLTGVKIFDSPKDDVIRMSSKYERLSNKDSIVKLIQITLFHDIKQQRLSLNYHKREKWVIELKRVLHSNSKLEYQCVDLVSGRLKNYFTF